MANNVFANGPYAVVAKQTISFVDAGITSLNMSIIYKIDGSIKSYKPERFINAITGFENGKGYYLVPKQDLDLSAYVVPPISLTIQKGFMPLTSFRVGGPGGPVEGALFYIVPEAIGKARVALFLDGALISDQGYSDVMSYTLNSGTGRVDFTRALSDKMIIEIYEVEN